MYFSDAQGLHNQTQNKTLVTFGEVYACLGKDQQHLFKFRRKPNLVSFRKTLLFF